MPEAGLRIEGHTGLHSPGDSRSVWERGVTEISPASTLQTVKKVQQMLESELIIAFVIKSFIGVNTLETGPFESLAESWACYLSPESSYYLVGSLSNRAP